MSGPVAAMGESASSAPYTSPEQEQAQETELMEVEEVGPGKV
jgi:hypothetical protein